MPHTLIIRKAQPADADACAEVNLLSWRNTYKGIIAGSTLEKMNMEDLLKKWRWRFAHPDPAIFCFVAEISGKAGGYLLCGPNRNKKFPQQYEVMAMYILEQHRRNGIGKKLFLSAVNEMRSRNIPSFLVFAIHGNIPAQKFYSSFHPHQSADTSLEIDGIGYTETCYGWNDISTIGT